MKRKALKMLLILKKQRITCGKVQSKEETILPILKWRSSMSSNFVVTSPIKKVKP